MNPHRLEIKSQFRSYAVLVGSDLLGSLGERLKELPLGRRCAVITDSNVAPLYADAVSASLRRSGFEPLLVVVPAGEPAKSLTQAGQICDTMIQAGLDRHAFVVALGGGVIGDLAGFVAAIYYRGIPLIQIPTTVIAQVDSAIGGKTGVNTVRGKNLLGAFYPPSLVLADVGTLDSLPQRAFDEGFAEIVKHAVIRDRDLFEKLETFQRSDLFSVVRRNLEIKAEIVGSDEFERSGRRALLNFGHTIGHAIEQAAGYGRLFHGEAISLGIVAASRLSVRKAGLTEGECERIIARLQQFHLPTALPAELSSGAIAESLARDKKFEEGRIRFVLTPAIGEAFLSEPGMVTASDLTQAVEDLRRAGRADSPRTP